MLSSFGVSNPLPEPVLRVYDNSGGLIAQNTGWANAPNSPAAVSAAALSTGAIALPNPSADTAVLLTLKPGAYTAQITSASGNSGIALFEAYSDQPQTPHLLRSRGDDAAVTAGNSAAIPRDQVLAATSVSPRALHGWRTRRSEPGKAVMDQNGLLANRSWVENGLLCDAAPLRPQFPPHVRPAPAVEVPKWLQRATRNVAPGVDTELRLQGVWSPHRRHCARPLDVKF